MTQQRTFVTFDAAFSDDAEFSSSGEIVIPGGRNVCLVIANLLADQELEVSEPSQHDFYGWEVTAKKEGHVFWFLLQYPGPWLLLAKDKHGVADKHGVSLGKVLNNLANAMNEDGRFSGLSWFTKAEYERGQTVGNPLP